MNLENLIEITSVFPSPLGGAIFKGVPIGSRSKQDYRASYKVITRIPKVGEFWRVTGEEVVTIEYGIVINVEEATLTNMPSVRYVGNLLKKHDAFRGIKFGKAKVNKLLDNIGDWALVDFLNKGDYLAISEAGLNVDIAKYVCEAWAGLQQETELATFLSENQLDSKLAAKITRLAKYDIVERLKRNPYALIALSKTTLDSLRTISDVAIKLGISSEDERASVGIVEFALYEQLNNGNTMISLHQLKNRLMVLRKEIKSKLYPDEMIKAALNKTAVCVFEENEQIYIQPIGAAFIEQKVEDALHQLCSTPLQETLNLCGSVSLSDHIRIYNEKMTFEQGYCLTDQQIAAVEMALTNRFSLLSGYGGTGKTTALKAICDIAEYDGITVHICALAGKAADRARKATGRQAYTIHSLINLLNKPNPKNEVSADTDPLIIIDEASMVDISLINSLISAFQGHPFKLLLVGDIAQLPPIGFGLFWHTLVDADIPKVHLTTVHRVVEDNPLHHSAMCIRNGEQHKLELYDGQDQGIFLLPIHPSLLAHEIAKLRTKVDAITLTAYASARFDSSTKKINYFLQQTLNAEIVREVEKKHQALDLGYVKVFENDPVIATTNVYALGIYNGMTGVVKSVSSRDGELSCEIQFDDRVEPTILTRDQCWQIDLDLAYALTIHKSQGSEYDACIVCLSKHMEPSALYTAITRTKKLCIVIGTQDAFNDAIARPPRYKTIKSGFRFAIAA